MVHHGLDAENRLFWRGLYAGTGEEQPLRLWLRLCSRARTALDIGANLGIYSFATKAVNPTCRVYGFEPVSQIFELFRDGCELNDFEIGCVRAALPNVDGETEICIQPGGFTTASLQPNDLRTERQPVTTLRLSTFIEREGLSDVDLMKIDVEGSEAEVLEGMGDYIRSLRPTILVEVLSESVGRRIEALVDGCEYLIFNIDETRGAMPEQRLSPEGKSRYSRNFLLCSRATAEWLGLGTVVPDTERQA
jgi:FkbM family methyltransferase